MALPRFLHRSHPIIIAGILAVSLGFLCSQDVHGQYWLQTARVVTPVENGPVRAFLDTLVHTIDERDLGVRRDPSQSERIPFSKLRSTLIEKHGTGITTANTVFLGYRFEMDFGSRLERDLLSLHFHFRPGPAQEDIPILYLDAQQRWVQEILLEKGTDLPTNEAAIIPFRRHLDFVHLARQDDTRIVEIGGETVRKGFEVKKEALIQKIERLMYGSLV